MNGLPPDDRDPQLAGVLKEWKVTTPLPPGFQERVWRRVSLAEEEAARPGPLVEAWLRLQRLLSRPGLAAGYMTALLVVGFAVGWARGLEKSAQIDAALSSRYLQVVDPYQKLGP